MKLHVLLFAAATVLLQTGCVVGRRTVPLNVPSLGLNAATKGDFHIVEVVDNRRFENKPASPSTPSVDGDVTGYSAEQRAGMIGRQRNTYGKAMGDIALPAGDTVVKRARLLLEEGLKHRGYQISSDPNAARSATVSIDEFWAWFTPGMWTVSFEARVYCTIKLKKADGSGEIVVRGYGMNKGQVASDANWQLAYEHAFNDFLAKLGPELDKAGF